MNTSLESSTKQRIVVVCGPTATGKSDFAVELALQIYGEIISADSRQVYRGLDIGSGMITLSEMKGVPHYLLDVADPRDVFSVTQYQALAVQAIRDIVSHGKVPIVVGGTGLYIDAIICNTLFPNVPPNETLRKELESKSLDELSSQLSKLDPRRHALIDKKNKVRLVRAIEIATELGNVPLLEKSSEYDVEWHYLDFADDILKKRIQDRLYKRIDEGMIEEIQALHKEGLSWPRLESLGLEYKYIALFLQEKLSKEDMLTQLEKAIWHYAKRQRTWFKKYART